MSHQLNHHVPANAEEMIGFIGNAARDSEAGLRDALEALPVPVYVTDADGWLTFANRACADFAGRIPIPGQDRWCVSWRLYTEHGVPLPHDQCPMAVTVRENKEVRGVVAVAERPDGTRILFTPYPSPLRDSSGELIGAVNILIDVTDERQAASLKAQALRCRRLAQSVSDSRTVRTLLGMAADYEQKARALATA